MAMQSDSCSAVDQLHVLATQGLEQLYQVVAIVKQLFSQFGYGDPGDALQRQGELQQQYLVAVGALRRTLERCSSLMVEVHNDQRAGPEAAEEPHAAAEGHATRFTQLQADISSKNEVIKQLVDQLRQMLESLCMWESHKHMLERYKLAEGH